MYDRDKFDWETREDAETLRRYQAIKQDPVRFNRAKECIQDSVMNGLRALGSKSVPMERRPGRSNPATIMKLR